MKFDKEPSIFCPLRPSQAWPILTQDHVDRNLGRSIETAIILDLNVIYRFEQVVFEGISLQDVKLEGFVNNIGRLRFASLCPGTAYYEVNKDFASRMIEAYNKFVEKYLPGFSDHPGAISTLPGELSNERLFSDSIDNKKQIFSYFYGAMLLMFIVSKQYANEVPERKFSIYIERLAEFSGMVGGIEALIAQFCFFDRNSLDNEIFRDVCGKIRSNFLKGGGSTKNIFLNCFNQAHDLYLVRSVAAASSITLDGFRQEIWIASADEGITNLATLFRYISNTDGTWDGSIEIIQPFDEMISHDFWNDTNTALNQFLETRRSQRLRSGDPGVDLNKIKLQIPALEDEVRNII